MKMKNDVSFIFDYRKLLERPEVVYSTRKLFIPKPKYVVFYNGSDKMMEKCKLLNDYSVFVAMVRENSCRMNTKDAIIKAMEDSIKQDVLTDFLMENRKEVAEMFWDEMDEEVIKEFPKREFQ